MSQDIAEQIIKKSITGVSALTTTPTSVPTKAESNFTSIQSFIQSKLPAPSPYTKSFVNPLQTFKDQGFDVPTPTKVEKLTGVDRDTGLEVNYNQITLPGGAQFNLKEDNTPFVGSRSLTTEEKETVRGGTFEETAMEVDHRVPMALGGTDYVFNLQALKDNKTITQTVYDFLTGNKRLPSDYKAQNRQEGKMIVEWEAIDKYQQGKITLWEAIAATQNYDNSELTASYLHKEYESSWLEKGLGFLSVIKPSNLAIGAAVKILETDQQAKDFIMNKVKENRRTGVINDVVGFFGGKHYVDKTPGEALIAEVGEGLDKSTVLRPGPTIENLKFFQSLEELGPKKVADEKVTFVPRTEPGVPGVPTRISPSLQAKMGIQEQISLAKEIPETKFLNETARRQILLTGTAPVRWTAGSLARLLIGYGLETTGSNASFTPQTEWQEFTMGKEDFTRLANSADIYGTAMRYVENELKNRDMPVDQAQKFGIASALVLGAVIENPFFSFGKQPAKKALERIMKESLEKELGGELSEKVIKEIGDEASKIVSLKTSVERGKAIEESISRWKNEASLKPVIKIEEVVPSKAVKKTIETVVEPLTKNLDGVVEAKAITPSEASTMKKVNKELSMTNLDPANAGLYLRTKQFFDDKLVKIVEAVQNDWVRVKKMVETGQGSADPYLKKVLFPGRVGFRMEQIDDAVKTVVKDRINTAKNINISSTELKKNVNEYLIARHAPERNKQLGEKAAGISTKEAEQKLAILEKLSYFDEITRLADEIEVLNKQTLEVLKEGQVISSELYETLTKTYEHHVPLNRIFDESEDVVDILSSRGLDVKSSGIKRAKGSERAVSDILGNITANLKEAIVRAEKNAVDLETLKFARENKEFGLFEELKPKVLGTRPDGTPIFDSKLYTDPTILVMQESGKPVFLKIGDRHLATIIKGLGREKIPSYLRGVAMFTRFYSGLATRFNPDFAFSNKIRDMQEVLTYIASQKEMGFTGATKVLRKDVASTVDVINYIRGIDSEGTKLYKQMQADGGTTGGMALSTKGQVAVDIEKIEKLMASKPKQATRRLIDAVDDWNRIFEDSSRLSVYKSALERGLSREEAAKLAKEASIDFNKMGTLGPVVNSLWMFSNASIQGSYKMIQAMKNPKVAAAVVSSVAGAVYVTNEWNDKLDPAWRDKVSTYDRVSNLVVILPPNTKGDFRYITIPVSWGIKPIKVASDYVYDFATDYEKDVGEAFKGILAATLEGYNPIGGTDLYSAFMPTIGDIPSEIIRNKSWTGSKIKPDWDQNLPASRQYYQSISESTVGDMAKKGTHYLSDVFGIEISPEDVDHVYNQLIGGAGRFTNKVVNTVSSISKGEVPMVRNMPLLSRFLKSRTSEEIAQFGVDIGESEAIKQELSDQAKERFDFNEQAEALYNEMASLPKEQAAAYWDQLNDEDAEMAKKIVELKKDEDLDLSYVERQIKNLGVENGLRAEYVYDELMALDTDSERAALWSDYEQKGIISKQVAEQLKILLGK
ncbi:MAG: LPD38 domain-containing protein [Candidatus Micrarchaeota archaeon]